MAMTSRTRLTLLDPQFWAWFDALRDLGDGRADEDEAPTWDTVASVFENERRGIVAKPSDWGEVVGTYNSTRDKTKIYTVRRFTGDTLTAQIQRIGAYGCDCPGWRFSKETPRICVHVRAANNGPLMQRAERILKLVDALVESGLIGSATRTQYRTILDAAVTSKTTETMIRPLINSAPARLLTLMEESGLFAPADTSNESRPGKTRLITLE